MKIIIAKVKVQQGKEAEFENIALELAKQVAANEPGNKLYNVCKSDKGEYCFVEMYENDEAIAAHRSAPHLRELGGKLAGVLEPGGPEITMLDVVGS